MAPAQAVILGHKGFIGRALSESFRRDKITVAGFSSAELDLRRFDNLARLDGELDSDSVLVIASALTLDRAPDTAETFQANVAMATNVAHHLEARRVGLCVYLSSFTIYGDAGEAPIDENTPARPATLYGAAKLTGELLLELACRKMGSPLLNLRLGRVYGPGAPRALYGPEAFVRSIESSGVVQLFGDGLESRDHIFIDDAVRLIRRLIDQRRAGTFNVVSGRSHSFQEVVAALRTVSPRPFRVVSVPRTRPVTRLAAFDVRKLTAAVPFDPLSLEEGLRRTFHA